MDLSCENAPYVPQECQVIDTHCHLDLEPLAGRAALLLEQARRAGVSDLVVPGVHPDGWHRIRRLAEEQPGVHAAFGIHPMYSGLVSPALLDQLAMLIPHGCAVGEIGLDTTYSVSLERQEALFRQQVQIAVQSRLPVLVHCRNAFQKTLSILAEEGAGQVGGIMHAFSGSVDMARQFIRLGFAISLSGTVTRPNAVKPLDLARRLPLDHLVLETDAPDMTPYRYRGRWNRPAWIMETARAVAELRIMDPADLAQACYDNSLRILPGLRGL